LSESVDGCLSHLIAVEPPLLLLLVVLLVLEPVLLLVPWPPVPAADVDVDELPAPPVPELAMLPPPQPAAPDAATSAAPRRAHRESVRARKVRMRPFNHIARRERASDRSRDRCAGVCGRTRPSGPAHRRRRGAARRGWRRRCAARRRARGGGPGRSRCGRPSPARGGRG